MSTLELGAQQPKGHTAVVAWPPLIWFPSWFCLSISRRAREGSVAENRVDFDRAGSGLELSWLVLVKT